MLYQLSYLAVAGAMLATSTRHNPNMPTRQLYVLRHAKSSWDEPELRDYDRPDFHPDDRDTTELVARWREELFGEHGRLNDRLRTAAA